MTDSLSPLAHALHNWAETSHVTLEQSDRKQHVDESIRNEPPIGTRAQLHGSRVVSSDVRDADAHQTKVPTVPRETGANTDMSLNGSLLETPRTSVKERVTVVLFFVLVLGAG